MSLPETLVDPFPVCVSHFSIGREEGESKSCLPTKWNSLFSSGICLGY